MKDATFGLPHFIIIIIALNVIVIIILINKFSKDKESKQNYEYQESKNNLNETQPKYEKKQLMTKCELYFFFILSENFAKDYLIIPQVNLASIITKNKKFESEYQNELNRNIDFGIFDKSTYLPLLLIEINDSSHNQPRRIERDKRVKDICSQSDIKLITFHTQFENEKNYVINRIKRELKRD